MLGLWTYHIKPIQIFLVVDDFGIKYMEKEHIEHLKQILEQIYKIMSDFGGLKYVKLNLEFDYKNREVHLSMHGYIQKALLTSNTNHHVNLSINHTPCAP